jgi:hypothetical protein
MLTLKKKSNDIITGPNHKELWSLPVTLTIIATLYTVIGFKCLLHILFPGGLFGPLGNYVPLLFIPIGIGLFLRVNVARLLACTSLILFILFGILLIIIQPNYGRPVIITIINGHVIKTRSYYLIKILILVFMGFFFWMWYILTRPGIKCIFLKITPQSKEIESEIETGVSC